MSQMSKYHPKNAPNDYVSHLEKEGQKNQKRNAGDNHSQLITFLIGEKRKIKTFINQHVTAHITFYVFVRLRFSFSRSIKFV